MEFPGDINVFDAINFETAVPRSTGRTTVELLVQARPTGRIADHYRLAMGGSALLEAKPVLSSIFPDPKLDGFLMVYQFWCKDVVIRRNMTTSRWMDCLTLITATPWASRTWTATPLTTRSSNVSSARSCYSTAPPSATPSSSDRTRGWLSRSRRCRHQRQFSPASLHSSGKNFIFYFSEICSMLASARSYIQFNVKLDINKDDVAKLLYIHICVQI